MHIGGEQTYYVIFMKLCSYDYNNCLFAKIYYYYHKTGLSLTK